MDFPSDLVPGRDANEGADVREKILATLGSSSGWLTHRQLGERLGGEHSDVMIERTIIDLRDAGVIDAREEGGDSFVRIHVEPERSKSNVRPLRQSGSTPGIRHDDLEALLDDEPED